MPTQKPALTCYPEEAMAEKIRRAAKLDNRTTAGFLLTAAIERAEKVIRRATKEKP